MSGLVAIIMGIAATFFVHPYFNRGTSRVAFWTLSCGLGFWYYLPGTNLLTLGHIGHDHFEPSYIVDNACWFVLLSHLCALGVLLTLRGRGAALRPHAEPEPAIAGPAFLILISNVAFLVVHTPTHTLSNLQGVLSGDISARAGTGQFASERGTQDALLGLWEVTNVATSLFLLAIHRLKGSVFDLSAVCIALSIAFLFIGSGTRAVVLQAVFVVLMEFLIRNRRFRFEHLRRLPLLRLAWGLAVLAPLVLIMKSSLMARFGADGSYAKDGFNEIVTATVLVNNDMTRELAFSMEHLVPNSEGVRAFLAIPFTYAMPRFLGFTRTLPPHLVEFNMSRAQIDLTLGVSNVFPGIVCDFWLIFGTFAPLVFATWFSLAFLVIGLAARVVPSGPLRSAYIISLSSYIFFCFRNTTGALALVAVILAIVGIAVGRAARQPR